MVLYASIIKESYPNNSGTARDLVPVSYSVKLGDGFVLRETEIVTEVACVARIHARLSS